MQSPKKRSPAGIYRWQQVQSSSNTQKMKSDDGQYDLPLKAHSCLTIQQSLRDSGKSLELPAMCRTGIYHPLTGRYWTHSMIDVWRHSKDSLCTFFTRSKVSQCTRDKQVSRTAAWSLAAWTHLPISCGWIIPFHYRHKCSKSMVKS